MNFFNCCRKNRLYLYSSLCCLVFCPESPKLPSGLTKLSIFFNKDYDYAYAH